MRWMQWCRAHRRLTVLALIILFVVIYFQLNSVEVQARKLGNRPFTPEAWATASQLMRAEMTASLLDQYDTSSFTRHDVVALLGPPTGYYDHDTNPAYFVGPTTVESMYGKGYLLVFQTNKYDGEVDSVFFFPEVE
ncbi:hypothetical protein [Massilia sp. CFBP9026]|uniref:hypothetical protein n=1 Tax=Massilia sp. CFBP9026 TaxID=3096536 RepID=UPI002A6AEA2E|nr:hypothetical protein [Massilia sp. CFBP9026]MDY0961221.1 hypothetical protein [Massilia sp. CFBP9026]